MRRNELPDACFSILPSTGQLIIIKKGESGYYPSEWDTGNREENRDIASSHNVSRGISDMQESAISRATRTLRSGQNFSKTATTIYGWRY